jgi:hypothetical protein
MLMVNAADIGAADGGGFDAEEDFAVTGGEDGILAELGGAIAGEDGALHFVGDGYAHCK